MPFAIFLISNLHRLTSLMALSQAGEEQSEPLQISTAAIIRLA